PDHDHRLPRLGRDQPAVDAAEAEAARLAGTPVQRAKVAPARPAGVLRFAPSRAAPNQNQCGGCETREEERRERSVEGDRPRDELAGAIGPGGGGVAEVMGKPEHDGRHLRGVHLRPVAAEQPPGELAGQPEQRAGGDEPRKQPKGERLERLCPRSAAGLWHVLLAVHAAALTSMRASVSTSSRSCDESRCWTRKERCPTFHSAQPRRSCGSSSASVSVSPRSSRAWGSWSGGCA